MPKNVIKLLVSVLKFINKIGYGHKEKFYQEAIAQGFREKKIEFKRELKARVRFKEKDLGVYYLDFLSF